jgi:hypothetical protein
MGSWTISDHGDTIDGGDISERLDELEVAEQDGSIADYEQRELAALQAFRHDVDEQTDDWGDGLTFIADRCFVAYAKSYAHDIGAIDSGTRWPFTHIDWDSAADELKHDFGEADLGSETYWFENA